ncbi:MAG: HNH endonuclease [Alcaligenaceae bacterium]|nr:MAG: HNH endonuclease [Alcaligenaceae bacterium]
MSAMAMGVFMDRIFTTRPSAAGNAVRSLWAHINYYEAHYKTRMHKLRVVVQKFEAKLSVPATLEHTQSELSRRVKIAQLDSSAVRRERLSNAPAIPSSRTVTAVVFDRNPDVIAEVLSRAGGVCEGCKRPAPFARVRTGEPYLEVHHRLRLADGNEDSVSNAIALCPNCHRCAHYGPVSP